MYYYRMTKEESREGRKREVLEHIIHLYVDMALPVSSKLVSERMGGNISSATVRNIMAELEEHGDIAQPHTSAGRVPTNSGYRRHVEALKRRIQIEKMEAERLAAEYTVRMRTIKDVIEKTSYLISRELNNAGVVIWPGIDDFYIKHMDLVKVRSEYVLAIVVTMTNAVRNHIVKLDEELDRVDLEKISNYMNTHFEGTAFSDVSARLKAALAEKAAEEGGECLRTAKYALSIIDSIIEEEISEEMYWDSLSYFADSHMYAEVDMAREMLRILSGKEEIIRFMREELPYGGIRTYIGEENLCDVFKSCGVVTCGYSLNGRIAGRIGVIGPTRMDYDRALNTISCLAGLVSAKLEEING
ncbi:MAG: heat-inducible transcriptional repressor HrcA [Candidatus Omnitrophota bacterium]